MALCAYGKVNCQKLNTAKTVITAKKNNTALYKSGKPQMMGPESTGFSGTGNIISMSLVLL